MTVRYPTSATDPSGADVETDNASLDNVPAVRLPQASDPCQADVLNAPAKQLLDRLALVEANLLWNAAGPAGRTQSAEVAHIGDNVTTAEMSIAPSAIATKLTYSYQNGCGWFYSGILGQYAVSCDTDCDFAQALINGTIIYSINASGQAKFQGVTCDGAFSVSGNSSLKNTSVTGNLTASGKTTTQRLEVGAGGAAFNSNEDISVQTSSGFSVSAYDNIGLNTSHGVVEIGGTTQITGNLSVSQRAAVSGELRASNITTLSLSKINIAVNNAVYELCEGNGSRIAYGNESLIASKLLERAVQFGSTLIFTGGIVADSVTAQSDMFPQTLIIDPTSVSSKVEAALGYLLNGTRMAALMIKDTTV